MDWIYTCIGLTKICCYRHCKKHKEEAEPRRDRYSFLLLGYSNTGKSTFLSNAAGEDFSSVVPTSEPGFSIKCLSFEQSVIQIKEVGGSESQRQYWIHYLKGYDAVIYMLDASTPSDDMEQSLMVLSALLVCPAVTNLPLVVIFNKRVGKPNSLSTIEMKELVENTLQRRTMVLQCCTQVPGEPMMALFQFLEKYFGSEPPEPDDNDAFCRDSEQYRL